MKIQGEDALSGIAFEVRRREIYTCWRTNFKNIIIILHDQMERKLCTPQSL